MGFFLSNYVSIIFTKAINEFINHFFFVAMDDDELLSKAESANGESGDDLLINSEEETNSDPFNDGEVLSSL